MARRVSLRPAGFDELGLRRALAGRMLPFLVAAMAFLAALALAGWVAAASLARHWESGAGAAVTVQVPRPEEPSEEPNTGGLTRLALVLALLRHTPGVVSARALSSEELRSLLRPWLGDRGGGGPGAADPSAELPLPGVIAVRLDDTGATLEPVSKRLNAAAPGTLVEDQSIWVSRLTTLAHSLQGCAAAALLMVAAVAAAVVAIATRAGLLARREAIEIVHGLGASDGYIARRFAARATRLAAAGGMTGGLAALPVLLVLARLASPFADSTASPDLLPALPTALWLLLPGLPLAAAAIGFLTAQGTVRRWLRRLP